MFTNRLWCRILVVSLFLGLSGCAGSSKSPTTITRTEQAKGDTDIEGMDLTVDPDDLEDGDSRIIELFKVCNSSHVDIDKLRKIVSDGVDVNQQYNFGGQYLSPLGVVCNRSDIDAEAVRVLLELGADVDGVSRTPFNRHLKTAKQYLATPLALACDRSHIDIEAINLLLDHGAKLQDDNYTMLDIVCNRSYISIEAIQTLVAHGADINAYSKLNGYTPVMVACNRVDIDIDALRVLVELGANINLGNKSNNDNAVMIATDRNNFDVPATLFLIDAGSNLNARADNGTVLLDSLVRDLELTKLAIQKGANSHAVDRDSATLLHYAGVWGSREVVSYLIESGFDINAKDYNKMTPVMYAAARNRFDVMKTLIDAGASIHDISLTGVNMMGLACYPKRPLVDGAPTLQPDIVKYLIEQGIDVNHADKYGGTPLLYAAANEEDTSEIVRMLLDAGADINHQTNDGRTVLDLVRNPNVKELLLSKASKSLQLKNELFKAVIAADTDRMKALFEAGVNVNELDANGRTPIWYAPNTKIAGLLIEHGADLNILDQYQNCLVTHYIGQDYINHAVSNHDPVAVEDRTEMLIFLMEHGAKPGLGDLGSYGSSQNKELSLAGVSSRLQFESDEQLQRFKNLYVTKDTVNLSSGSGDLLYDTINGMDYYYPFKLSQTPEDIIHLLDLGALIESGHSKSNRFIEYLGSPSVPQSKEVVRKFLDVIPPGTFYSEIFNSNYRPFNSSEAVPLLILIIKKYPEFVEEVLQRGADPNAQIISDNGIRYYHTDGTESYKPNIKYGDTALMTAVSMPNVVKLLIKAGADVNAKTSDGDTALKRAQKGNYTKTIELLKNAGAK